MGHVFSSCDLTLQWRRCPRRLVLVMLCVLVTPASWAAIAVTPGSDSTKTVIRGMLVTPDQVLDRMLVIDGDRITCVAHSRDIPIGATH